MLICDIAYTPIDPATVPNWTNYAAVGLLVLFLAFLIFLIIRHFKNRKK